VIIEHLYDAWFTLKLHSLKASFHDVRLLAVSVNKAEFVPHKKSLFVALNRDALMSCVNKIVLHNSLLR
jgi:hypothetical protein